MSESVVLQFIIIVCYKGSHDIQNVEIQMGEGN